MMRSMYSAVSGLRAHQNKMDVIGNNIANVNTVGYKKGQMTFQEVFSQTIRGAGAPQDGRGGTNPQQVGLGVDVGAINTVHTKGSPQRTDDPTDIMINGEGFFVVTDDSNFENRYYTRAGDFTFDGAGNLVTPDGHKLLGYTADEKGNISTELGPIIVNRSETVEPTATTEIEFDGNLDSRSSKPFTTDTIIKDSLGGSWLVEFEFTKSDKAPNQWDMTLKGIKNSDTGIKIPVGTNGVSLVGGGDNKVTMNFSESGKIDKDSIKNISLNFKNEVEGEDEEGNKVDLGVSFGSEGEVMIFDPEVESSYNMITQYENDRDIEPNEIGGNSSGKLNGFGIDSSGIVVGSFNNGKKKALGQIVLAKFDNPMGLQKEGNNFFINTRNSGEPQLGRAGTNGFGVTNSGNLEMSNVDLSMEFTEMITTQRGFQANSRIITTSDEMLQELVNIKR